MKEKTNAKINATFLILDFETRSTADLKAVGAYNYALHPSTQILCAAWRVGTKETLRKAPVKCWSPAFKDSDSVQELVDGLLDSSLIVVAHNAAFERVIIENVLSRKFPEVKGLPVERFKCTAAQAAALALPRDLEGACAALKLPIQKDMEGRKLILKYCKPRRPTKNNPALWHQKASDLRRIMEYCRNDILAETELFLSAPELSEAEHKVWLLDQRINDRGFKCDRAFVESALEVIKKEIPRLEKAARNITGIADLTLNQVVVILAWLKTQGLVIPNLQAKTVDDVLKVGGMPPKPTRVLELRRLASKSSTKKYRAFLNQMGPDDRARGTLLYHGASTGRWSGRGIQPHNFPRTKLKSLDLIHHWVHTRDPEMVDAFWRPPLETLSKTLRSVIKTDKTFFGGDFSAIEARVLFWLSGHAAGLRAYHEGRDLYREIAAVIYNVKLEDVTSEQREIGKRALLGCLAEGTEVITSNGVKQIQNISKGDLLWNGQKWVTHEGVLRKGLKTVIKMPNLSTELTHDHWILTENGWRTAGEMAMSGDTLPLKLGPKTEGSKSYLTSLKKAVSGVSVCAAYVELKKNVELINFGSEKICCVAGVRSPFAVKKGDDPETAAFWLIGNLENVGTLVSTTLEKDASEILTKTGTGMAVAEFESSSNPFANFWNTLLHSMGLTNPFSRWTELITTGTTLPETYESLTKALTTKTVETYDIAEVADGNRFALADGTLVHNCGYGMGHKKFKLTCEQFGVLVSEELAQHAVNVYRDVHFPVPTFWKLVESSAIAAVKNPGQVFSAGEKIKWVCGPRFLFAVLPSGRRLAYAFPRIKYEPAPWGEKFPRLYFWSVHPKTKKWTEGGTYGGALVENLTQATARDLMVNAMQICERAGYETLLTVHDEILTEHQKGSLEEIEKLMTEVPRWASGCPIAVSVWSDKRYNKG